MWTGYGYLNSTEIWNNQRVMDYMRGDPVNGQAGMRLITTTVTRGEGGCDYANRLFCDPPLEVNDWRYTNPADDDAPWYDAQVPESAEFAGLFVTEVTGFDSTVNRTVTDNAILGASLGPLRLGGRTMTVTGWLMASTCCGAEYGLGWLTEALIGGTGCGGDCALGEMVMLKCCPTDDCPTAMEYVRYLEQVGLSDGPNVVDRLGSCCTSCGSTMLKVQFTLVSQSPYIFSEVDWCAYRQEFDYTEKWFDFYNCGPCGEAPPATWQPSCGPAVITPPAPFTVTNNCYCDPWCSFTQVCTFDNTQQWNDATGYMEIYAGSIGMRNLKVSAYRNAFGPQGLSCADFIADGIRCRDACAVLEVAELPPNGTLIIDSRTRTVALKLPQGNYVPGLRYISGEAGGPFNWFDVGHCSVLCVVVTVDCLIDIDAYLSIGHVNRYLASGG